MGSAVWKQEPPDALATEHTPQENFLRLRELPREQVASLSRRYYLYLDSRSGMFMTPLHFEFPLCGFYSSGEEIPEQFAARLTWQWPTEELSELPEDESEVLYILDGEKLGVGSEVMQEALDRLAMLPPRSIVNVFPSYQSISNQDREGSKYPFGERGKALLNELASQKGFVIVFSPYALDGKVHSEIDADTEHDLP